MPLTLNTTVFIVIVAVFEVTLSVPGTARHGSNRQHIPKVALFEIRVQGAPFGSLSILRGATAIDSNYGGTDKKSWTRRDILRQCES
jgi:hypothetical protein